ncbi:DUF3975 family protein [Bacillus cytotoxicus]|uniref:DUF3975 family protein n=1 Tax=Bacillus cereus group sp. BfR-BA-01492 TaxID=2920361 RepID=UPI001F5816DD|nr:DUF3975 family protein [Bacillus cereus group sp. BfR-BA-01492]EMA6341560.1 DUF3975 family protein [Bacillus cytotoxicus]
MWKEKGKQIGTILILSIAILLQISFHIIEWLFHKAIAILTFFPDMALEVISIVWSIVASILIIIIWSIAKLWNTLFKKDSSSKQK